MPEVPKITTGLPKKASLNPEFKVTDEDLEIMADAALGPEPEEEGDDVLRLPGDLSAAEAHKAFIQDRLRAARLTAAPSAQDVLSARRKRRFIVRLAETGVIAQACASAGWSLTTAKSLRKTDKLFSDAWDEAIEVAADAVEAEAFRRGVHGVEKNIYFKGEKVGKEVIYSDRLLERILEARKPEQFRANSKSEIDIKGGVLVVPAAPSEGDWEKQSTAGQSQYRDAPPEE